MLLSKKIKTLNNMNFIESLFKNFEEVPVTVCIGSGSNFEIYTDVNYLQAFDLYKSYVKELSLGGLGRRISSQQNGLYILESFHAMESSTGITYCFMFPVIIKERLNNDKKRVKKTDKN